MNTIHEAGCLVAGEWLTGGEHVDRMGPYLRETVSRARTAQPGDITAARTFAGQAAKQIARLAPATRADILERAAASAIAQADQLAGLLAVELGKPLKDGRGEIARVADTLSVAAAEARMIGGEVLPVAGWG
ncbi:aldehyde dehydrogenase family protein, partial [Nonomuraea sp. K271]